MSMGKGRKTRTRDWITAWSTSLDVVFVSILIIFILLIDDTTTSAEATTAVTTTSTTFQSLYLYHHHYHHRARNNGISSSRKSTRPITTAIFATVVNGEEEESENDQDHGDLLRRRHQEEGILPSSSSLLAPYTKKIRDRRRRDDSVLALDGHHTNQNQHYIQQEDRQAGDDHHNEDNENSSRSNNKHLRRERSLFIQRRHVLRNSIVLPLNVMTAFSMMRRKTAFAASTGDVSQEDRKLSSSLTMISKSKSKPPEVDYIVPTPITTSDIEWPLGKVAFSLLPLSGTYTRRYTIEECIVPDTIWTYDQIQGIVNVNVPVRQTVVNLASGGLWIHNPVAPTKQLLNMMYQLVDKYGPIKHIVLGTVALEHKATFGAFASYFPNATVWIQPGQWSFPVQIPIEFYGLVQRGQRLREIPILSTHDTNDGSSQQPSIGYRYWATKKRSDDASSSSSSLLAPEWISDFDYEVLGPLSFRSVGGFSETAFYHRSTQTLIVTDVVISVTETPPPIIQEDPRALIYHCRDYATQPAVQDTIENRKRGWRRMVQFGLVFFPSQIGVVSVGQAFQDANQIPSELRNLGNDAIPFNTPYPWYWNENDADFKNFQILSHNGQLFCPPILTKLILDREPVATLQYVDRICKRFQNMKRIIPCHLNNNIQVNGCMEFYNAFDSLRSRPDNLIPQRVLAEDLALLQKASDLLTKYGIVSPSLVCDGELARKKGRFATTTTTNNTKNRKKLQ